MLLIPMDMIDIADTPDQYTPQIFRTFSRIKRRNYKKVLRKAYRKFLKNGGDY